MYLSNVIPPADYAMYRHSHKGHFGLQLCHPRLHPHHQLQWLPHLQSLQVAAALLYLLHSAHKPGRHSCRYLLAAHKSYAVCCIERLLLRAATNPQAYDDVSPRPAKSPVVAIASPEPAVSVPLIPPHVSTCICAPSMIFAVVGALASDRFRSSVR